VIDMRTVTLRPPDGVLVDAPVTTTGETVVVPLGRPDGRPVAVVITDHDGARIRPVVDIERLAWCAVTATALVAAAVAAHGTARGLARRRPAIGSVSMGPGGWVSLKGAPLPPLLPADRRPWWARLLRARRLVVE
jgi:hypothetical protein